MAQLRDGVALVDDCGVCDGGNADKDCAGTCGGSASTDNCGTCDADDSNDCVQDCAGVWGGTDVEADFYIDAIAMATGNDFRAIEACAHAYACRSGKYSSLSNAFIKNKNFIFEIELPLSMGTVGGLTKLHPIVNWSLELLNFPDSKSLMEITAVAGLAQNFAAIKSLITSGIQKGHMKMHLLNILKQKGASENQKIKAINFFKKI